MSKNVILLHLESISSQLFWNYQAQLPFLWNLRNRSIYFNRCNVAGSATVFAMQSLNYGHQEEFDAWPRYSAEALDNYQPSPGAFFEWLRSRHGYETIFCRITDEPLSPRKHAALVHCHGLVDMPGGGEDWAANMAGWLKNRDRQKPFLALLTTIPMDPLHYWAYFNKIDYTGFGTAPGEILRRQDSAYEKAMSLIADHVSPDQCLVIAYGDHGYDLDQKNDDTGISHGVGVASKSTWVPLFIAGGEWEAGVTDQLASLDDLPFTIAGQLFGEENHYTSNAQFPGIDLARERRQYVFSQNKYALQFVDIAKGYSPKSYAITDGVYRLMVTAIESERKKGGMTLYFEAFDSASGVDLLRFFKLDQQGNPIGVYKSIMRLASLEFFLNMNPFGLPELAEKIRELRTLLLDYVETKEKLALSHPAAEANILPKEAFAIASADWHRDPDVPWIPLPRTEGECARRLGTLCSGQNDILLFGCREKEVFHINKLLTDLGLRAVGVLDNNAVLQGGSCQGLSVLSPGDAANQYPGAVVVSTLAGQSTNTTVAEQCHQLGFRYYSFWKDIFNWPLSP